MNTQRRAFTLVELLVVIAIIGLLSTVAVVATGASRVAARDVRRKADLRQISQAVELFLDANGYLPRNAATWCTTISNPTNGWGPAFQGDLSPTYMGKVPLDPTQANTANDYIYYSIDNKTKYSLCATLEKPPSGSFGVCTGYYTTNYCISPNGI